MSSPTPPPRPRHLMDPSNPQPPPVRRPVDVERVQRWVLSTLVVTTLAHLAAGVAFAGFVVDEQGRAIGLFAVAVFFSAIGIAVALVIHRRSWLSPWLLLSAVPVLVVWAIMRL